MPTTERQVFLVEDDPQDAELFLLACRELDLDRHVVVLADAAQALKTLRQAASAVLYPRSLPAVAILDLRMPGMNGLDFIDAIRSDPHLAALPLVVLTSSQEPRDVLACYQRGANAYVVKPTDFRQFLEAIQLLVRFWLLVNEPLQ